MPRLLEPQWHNPKATTLVLPRLSTFSAVRALIPPTRLRAFVDKLLNRRLSSSFAEAARSFRTCRPSGQASHEWHRQSYRGQLVDHPYSRPGRHVPRAKQSAQHAEQALAQFTVARREGFHAAFLDEGLCLAPSTDDGAAKHAHVALCYIGQHTGLNPAANGHCTPR